MKKLQKAKKECSLFRVGLANRQGAINWRRVDQFCFAGRNIAAKWKSRQTRTAVRASVIDALEIAEITGGNALELLLPKWKSNQTALELLDSLLGRA